MRGSGEERISVMHRLRDLGTRMKEFGEAQDSVVSDLDVFQPSSSRPHRAPVLPVSGLRHEMSEVAEMMDAHREILQDLVDSSRRQRETAEALMSAPVAARPRPASSQGRVRPSTSMGTTTSSGSHSQSLEANAFTLKKTLTGEDGEALTCVICLEVLESGQSAISLPCAHCFHTSCIRKWVSRTVNPLKASCPTCKRPVSGEHEQTRTGAPVGHPPSALFSSAAAARGLDLTALGLEEPVRNRGATSSAAGPLRVPPRTLSTASTVQLISRSDAQLLRPSVAWPTASAARANVLNAVRPSSLASGDEPRLSSRRSQSLSSRGERVRPASARPSGRRPRGQETPSSFRF